MKHTLLDLTQKILQSLVSEDVNSLTDTEEAIAVSSILEDTYFRLISNRTFPEHKEFIKLVAASDSEYPTHFRYPENVTCLETLWYATDAEYTYKKLDWVEPEEFIYRTDRLQSNYKRVTNKVGDTYMRVSNNANPTFYTSFDDDWIVCNSWDNSVEDTLLSEKSRAYVVKQPSWSPHDDTFVPDLDENFFPLLLEEAKLVAFSELKGGPDSANIANLGRSRSSLQYRKTKSPKGRVRSPYGR